MMNLFTRTISMRRAARAGRGPEAGFSLLELVIAMAILLVMMAGASQILMRSLGARTRENQRSDALSDAQRALNIMSREIGNSGFGLDYNGLVAADCRPVSTSDPVMAQIRFRSNINNTDTTTNQADEDVTYVYQGAPNYAIVRYDKNTNTSTVLASRIDAMQITYIDAAGTASTLATPAVVAGAERIRITIQVNLDAMVGQPASKVYLTSEIAIRNATNAVRHY
ncbi:MAG TPA: prepilin-type N-terminal cleavage/methylation domain-containing protein [Pyrinomonadaceae bacterium]